MNKVYTMEVLTSFDVSKAIFKYGSLKGEGKRKSLVNVYADELQLGWLDDKEKQKLLNRVTIEDGYMILRGGNIAVRIINEKENDKNEN